jgi:methylmalonyl-CoA mutase N-terminal domain/subunit
MPFGEGIMFDPKKIQEIENQFRTWDEKVEKALRKNPERREEFQTTSGIPLKRVFTPADLANLDYGQDLGFPGEHPYTRGVQPTQYRGRFWTMRQYAGFGTAEDTNRRYRYLLEQGQTERSARWESRLTPFGIWRFFSTKSHWIGSPPP